MINWTEAEQVLSAHSHLISGDHTDLGAIVRIYLDEYTNWPSFATVLDLTAFETRAGTAEAQEIFIALHEATVDDHGQVYVPYSDAIIAGAMRLRVDTDPTIEEEDHLFEYYNVPIEGVEPAVNRLGSVLTNDNNETAVAHEPLREAPGAPR